VEADNPARFAAVIRLIDTDLVIDFLRGYPPGLEYIKRSIGISIHPVTALEILSGVKDKRGMQVADAFVKSAHMVELNHADVTDAMAIVKGYRLRSGVGWADALVAATAIRLDATVVSRNRKHFDAIAGLRLETPY